jgi:hypothetical protein
MQKLDRLGLSERSDRLPHLIGAGNRIRGRLDLRLFFHSGNRLDPVPNNAPVLPDLDTVPTITEGKMNSSAFVQIDNAERLL